jgi:alcohol dehydrogenase class IV
LHAARLLGAETGGAGVEDAGEILASQIERIMRRVGMPNGLSGVGLGADDVDALVAGTLPQHRVTKLSPRPATAEDLCELFLSAMQYW